MNDLYSVMRRREVELLTSGGEKWIEVDDQPGVNRTRIVIAEPWVEERTDCFCCSCELDSLSRDPYCRNHGWVGRRPCEAHKMAGSADIDILSVEKYKDSIRRNAIKKGRGR